MTTHQYLHPHLLGVGCPWHTGSNSSGLAEQVGIKIPPERERTLCSVSKQVRDQLDVKTLLRTACHYN